MILRLINDALVLFIVDDILIAFIEVYTVTYFQNRISLIFLFMILSMLKKAQLALNNKKKTLIDIIEILIKQRRFGRILVFINVWAIINLILEEVMIFYGDDKVAYRFIIVLAVVGISVFLLNFVTFCFYYSMMEYFM